MKIIYKLQEFPDRGDRDLYNGIQEINKNKYGKALEYFEKSSKYDNEYGFLFTAIFYFTGLGLTERNPPKALKMLKTIASVWNHRVAQYLIGLMYFQGDKDICANEQTGTHWLLLAANNGWSDAMTYAGISYYHASDVGNNINNAISLLEKVASNDDTNNKFIDNGTLYLFGNKDFELSMADVKPEILRVINSKKEYTIFSPIKYIEQERDSIIPDSKELRILRIWNSLTNKKSSGVATAQAFLSRAYISNDMPVKNFDKALYWAKKAAKNEDENIYILLGLFYSDGNYVKPDYDEAMKWFKKAFNSRENMSKLFDIAIAFHLGEGVKKNCAISLRIYKEYIARFGVNNGWAYALLGDIYKSGDDGVPRNYRKARECFLKAYELGDSEGATSLGVMYFQGQGVEKNTEKAFQWFRKGASKGSSLAKLVLVKNRIFM